MPFDLFKEIKDDFKRENYEMKYLTNLDNNRFLSILNMVDFLEM